MQRALDLLSDRDAIKVVNRGHLGRWIEHVNIGHSWQAAGLSPARILLPPSGSIEIDVLSEMLAVGLSAIGIPHTVNHLRGGAGRLAAIGRGEFDVALVSVGAWLNNDLNLGSDSSAFVRTLAPGTYYAPRRLVVVTRQGTPTQSIRRVAIDRTSSDHVALTLGEFPESDGYEYVDAPFPAVPAWVLRNRVDAGIWHLTSSVVPLDLAGIDLKEFQRPEAIRMSDTLSGASLVCSRQRPELKCVIEALSLDDLLNAQQTAMESERKESIYFQE